MEPNANLDSGRKDRPAKQTVTIGGETFTARATVRPEALIEWDDFWLGEDTSSRRQLEVADLTIKRFLMPEDHSRYDALRAREDDPLTAGDLRALVEALVAASAERPTDASSASETGTGSGEASSTEGSSSRAVLQSI